MTLPFLVQSQPQRKVTPEELKAYRDAQEYQLRIQELELKVQEAKTRLVETVDRVNRERSSWFPAFHLDHTTATALSALGVALITGALALFSGITVAALPLAKSFFSFLATRISGKAYIDNQVRYLKYLAEVHRVYKELGDTEGLRSLEDLLRADLQRIHVDTQYAQSLRPNVTLLKPLIENIKKEFQPEPSKEAAASALPATEHWPIGGYTAIVMLAGSLAFSSVWFKHVSPTTAIFVGFATSLVLIGAMAVVPYRFWKRKPSGTAMDPRATAAQPADVPPPYVNSGS